MRTLITGSSGFVGRHLCRYLLQERPGQELYGIGISTHSLSGVQLQNLDLCEEVATKDYIAALQPTTIYHLAAQAFVPLSFQKPWETLANNIHAQLNVLTACLELPKPPRIVIVSSGEIYGNVRSADLPLGETAPLRPASPYSVSKAAQDLLASQYHISHRLPILRARPFNHFGPGQDARFMAADFARQIAHMETGAPAILKVGNLTTRRDFTDVRDIVRAYVLIAERGEAGAVYNIASGVSRSAKDVARVLRGLTPIRFRVEVQKSRLRPADTPDVVGDASRLCAATGWSPEITFEQSLRDLLDDSRQQLAAEENGKRK